VVSFLQVLRINKCKERKDTGLLTSTRLSTLKENSMQFLKKVTRRRARTHAPVTTN